MHEKRKWSPEDMPDLGGRVALVTGGDRGLGAEIVKALVKRNCRVIIAGNERERMARFAEELPLTTHFLDLGDLTSVTECASRILNSETKLDLLVNNAGVMMIPYGTTSQGFERHFGINHLGHFALTGLMLPLLTSTPGSRIVTMSSNGHKMPGITFDDVYSDADYKPAKAYGRSKLANLLFAQELARRLQARSIDTLSLACHPGQSSTNPHETKGVATVIDRFIGQSAVRGAEPALRAATDPTANQGDYFGPGGLMELRGSAVRVKPARAALDPETAQNLWEWSEEWTGVHFLSQ